MATPFDSIPVRSDGQDVFATWFNVIRTALRDAFGSGITNETTWTIANNQASAADITGLLVSSASHRAVVAELDVRRKTDTASSEVRAIVTLWLLYDVQAAAWELADWDARGDDGHGVTPSVTAAGQAQYVSSNIAGANYTGPGKFRILRSYNA